MITGSLVSEFGDRIRSTRGFERFSLTIVGAILGALPWFFITEPTISEQHVAQFLSPLLAIVGFHLPWLVIEGGIDELRS